MHVLPLTQVAPPAGEGKAGGGRRRAPDKAAAGQARAGRLYEHQSPEERAAEAAQNAATFKEQGRYTSQPSAASRGGFPPQVLAALIASMGGTASSFTKGAYIDLYV